MIARTPIHDIPVEVQFLAPRTILRAWLLLLLYARPAHGYELGCRLDALMIVGGSSRVYRALRWLDGGGFVTPSWETTGGGPARRVYTLSPPGSHVLDVIAPHLRKEAVRLNVAFLVESVDMVDGAMKVFDLTVRTRLSVEARDETTACLKVERWFARARSLGLGVRATGDVRVSIAPGASSKPLMRTRAAILPGGPVAPVVVSPRDHADASVIASTAGRILVSLRHRLDHPGADPGAVRAAGDRLANQYILQELTRRHPDDAILSEEAVDDIGRVDSRRTWIVDPLDGTREFGEAGRIDWAVHVALAVDGAVVVGAVALPARGLTLTTASPPRPPPSNSRQLRMLVSRTRPPPFALALAQRLDAILVPMGSAGAKAMSVVLGEGDVFVHAGGQYEWDNAAPAAVAAAAGLHVSRIDGSPLRYNNANPWMPDILICTKAVAGPTLEALRHVVATPQVESQEAEGSQL